MPFPWSCRLSCGDGHCFSLSLRGSISIVIFRVANSGTAVSEQGLGMGLSTDVTVVRSDPLWMGPLSVSPPTRPVHVVTIPRPLGATPAAPLYLPQAMVNSAYQLHNIHNNPGGRSVLVAGQQSLTWYCMNHASSCNTYINQQDAQNSCD